jgi:cell division protein FtsZ
VPGLINLDFADVRAIMSEGGAALMAVGRATGEDRAAKAAELAISSQLLDVTIDGARGILFNITGGDDLTLFEVNEAAAIIKETAHPDVNLIFGAVVDPNMQDELRLTVIATGFEQPATPQTRRPESRRQPASVGADTAALFSGRSRGRQEPQRRPAAGRAVESDEAGAPPAETRARPATQPEPFPVRSFDKEDLDIPAFLRRR